MRIFALASILHMAFLSSPGKDSPEKGGDEHIQTEPTMKYITIMEADAQGKQTVVKKPISVRAGTAEQLTRTDDRP